VHAFRIAPDDAFHAGPHAGKQPFVLEPGVLANYSAPRYAFGGDREVALAVVGPTLRFRELHDEMVIAEANENAARPVRDRLVSDSRSSGGRGPLVLGLACLLLLLGACTKIAAGMRCVRGALGVARTATASHSYSLAALASGAAMMLAGAYLVGRLGFVFSLVPLLSTHAGPG
jgi:NADH-quinone oxidoreductase subunit L